MGDPKLKTEKACPLCEEQVPLKAKRCRHCGAVFRRIGGSGPGLVPGDYKDVPDLGLPGVLAVVGAIVGFVVGFGRPSGEHAMFVCAAALFGLAIGTGLAKQKPSDQG